MCDCVYGLAFGKILPESYVLITILTPHVYYGHLVLQGRKNLNLLKRLSHTNKKDGNFEFLRDQMYFYYTCKVSR